MIDARIEAELALDIAAFVGAAGDADNPRPLPPCKLARDRADRTRSRRHDDGLAALRPAALAQPPKGGEPRHAEDAECGGERRLARIELEQSLARDRAVELPAIAAQNVVALAKSRIARARHRADDAAFDHRADFSPLGIGPDAADPAAHIRTEREIDPAHQYLARAWIGQRRVRYLEIGWRRHTGRPPFQQHLSVPVFHPVLLPVERSREPGYSGAERS